MNTPLSRSAPAAVVHTVLAVSLALGGDDRQGIAGEPIPSPEAFTASAHRAGLRVLAGRRLVLATDRAARDGDGVEQLCDVFDEAFENWCRHYTIPSERTDGWRALGCLVVDRETFRAAGLLPDAIPTFANGYCDRSRFWLADQSNPDYRRHLLLHEGVHAFTLTLRGLEAPTWYTEGIAELLATHRLDAGRFVATPIPRDPDEVEQLGRIEELRRLTDAGQAPSLADVLATPGGAHRRIADYAASWAAVAMLSLHPRHADGFRELESGPLDPSLTARLRAGASWDESLAARDFAAFLDDIGHGFDFRRSAIDWHRGRLLDAAGMYDVAAGKGWQNTGVSLGSGEAVSFEATGRCRLGVLGDHVIETEADGISLAWHRGRPLGRLLFAQWIEDGTIGRFVVIGEGRAGTIRSRLDGPLFVRLNEPPGELADSEGSIRILLEPQAEGEAGSIDQEASGPSGRRR
jgi:hypothetical protein